MHTYGYGSAKVSLYSTNDIKILQLLSPFPSKLNLNGRAFMSEIVQYIFDVSYFITFLEYRKIQNDYRMDWTC